MKSAEIRELKKSILISVSIAMFALLSIAIISTSYVKSFLEKEKENIYANSIDYSIEHTIRRLLNDYDYRVRRVVESTNLAEFIKNRDREGLLKLLHSKYLLMKEENQNFTIMHVHLSDGTSFLRLHKPESFGDQLSHLRPMIKEIHKNHKLLAAYETGKHGTDYRIVSPIFDKDGVYVGAFELGFNPIFLLKAIEDINRINGLMFIKDSELKLYSKANDMLIDGYRLQSDIPPALEKVQFQKTLEDDVKLSVDGTRYLTHLISLKNYAGKESVKIIFFQKTSQDAKFIDNMNYRQFFIIFLGFIFLVWFLYRRFSKYELDVSELYLEQIKKIKESEEKFELFMQNVPASVFIKDESRTIIFANNTAKEFFDNKEVIGLKSENILSPKQAAQANAIDGVILEHGYIDVVEEYSDFRGEKHTYRIMGFIIKNGNAKNIGTIIVDITQSYNDKKKLEEQEELMIIQSRHAAMGEMISMIAHQWRQPISVISMYANNILADIELETLDEKSLREYTEGIETQTQELSKTIDDFRNFFKPERIMEETSVEDVLHDALGVIGKSLENNDIEVALELESCKNIETYSRELMQVIINIIQNAKDALLEKEIKDKKILISLKDEETFLSLRVCDNAGGVAKEHLFSVFDAYFTTKGAKDGTGLGLYMSKTIVEKHLHGSLEVTNVGEGACFALKLPFDHL